MGKAYAIFPQPLWISKIDRQLSSEEKDFIFSLKKANNTFNECSISKTVLNDSALANLRKDFEFEISQFTKDVLCPKNEIEIYITKSWINYTKSCEAHFSHCHPNSFISGVYYIQSKKEDKITFQKNYSMIRVETESYNMFNSNSWDVPAETGTLILFPSNIIHSVNPLDESYDGSRVSLSFNTFIKGKIEDNSSSSSLIIM